MLARQFIDGVKSFKHEPLLARMLGFPEPFAIGDEPGALAVFEHFADHVRVLRELARFGPVPRMDEKADLHIVQIGPPHIDRECALRRFRHACPRKSKSLGKVCGMPGGERQRKARNPQMVL